MDLKKQYETSEGVKCNILQLVKKEPEWAANMIQHYERKIARLSVIQPATPSVGPDMALYRNISG